jgi:hypothetical protein
MIPDLLDHFSGLEQLHSAFDNLAKKGLPILDANRYEVRT